MTTGALLLDLDGTLLDTPTAIASTLQTVLGEHVDGAAIRASIGKPLDTSIAKLLGVPPDDPAVDAAVARYREIFARDVVPAAGRLLLPDVLSGLDRARRAGLRTAVVTSKILASAEALIDGARLGGYLDAIVGHDMVARGKPNPDMAFEAAARLDVAADSCVVIGDGADDIRMAVAAGMPSVGVTTGVGSAEDLLSVGATEVVDGFGEAVDAAARLLGLTDPVP
jgi:phosphoglycolate phosphatase